MRRVGVRNFHFTLQKASEPLSFGRSPRVLCVLIFFVHKISLHLKSLQILLNYTIQRNEASTEIKKYEFKREIPSIIFNNNYSSRPLCFIFHTELHHSTSSTEFLSILLFSPPCHNLFAINASNFHFEMNYEMKKFHLINKKKNDMNNLISFFFSVPFIKIVAFCWKK